MKCDVTKWEDQLEMFREAVKFSPTGNIDIVVANAGLAVPQDSIFTPESMNPHHYHTKEYKLTFVTASEEPQKPDLETMDVNLNGVLYTAKLALFYFRRQFSKNPSTNPQTSLVLQSSMAGFLDFPTLVEYNTSKFAVRGLMRSLRRTESRFGTRVNLLAPWYYPPPPSLLDTYHYINLLTTNRFIKTSLLKDPSRLGDIDFAEVEDATTAFLHVVSDPDTTGSY